MNLDHLPSDLADYASQVAASAGMALREVVDVVGEAGPETPPLRALHAGWACPSRDGERR
ncbi:hypothetical protein [Promicromonospora sp. NFX87]|uniref:hypothetical protein n=1 Tax=Promicromonospora sp. NFX87 TaxID=3402691 RepID=UPI003AFAB974